MLITGSSFRMIKEADFSVRLVARIWGHLPPLNFSSLAMNAFGPPDA
jgi:hypothetical protein